MSAQFETVSGGVSGLGGFISGVKVLDLSQYIPGPMATLFLADMGAEVIKIEPPGGDEMRKLGPRDAADRPIFYESMNAGKSVCRMNLKDPAEKAEFLSLIETADVVVEGFRPGVMQRLGIDYPILSRVNPGIILCSISGYGTSSPLASVAGHDANYLALMGVLDRNGTDVPAYFDPPVSDVAGSLFAAMSILGALHGRERTGRGCFIDLALADTVMPLQMMQVAAFGATGSVPRRRTYYLNGGTAFYHTYRLADGRHAFLGAIEPKFWKAFCMAAGRPDWIDRQSEATPQTRLQADVAALLETISTADALRTFGSVDCCFSLVNDLGEALEEPHVSGRQLVREDGQGTLQSLFPAWVNGSPPSLRSGLSTYDRGLAPPPDAAAMTMNGVTTIDPRGLGSEQ